MSWYSRLTNTLSSRKLDDEIAEELQAHIEALAERLTADGLNEAEALRQARVQFGNKTLLHERTRESKLAAFADSLMQDVRYTFRSMRKAPGFHATAALSLALAIGAVTAIYSILAAAVLRPLPVRDPEQLVMLAASNPNSQGGELTGMSSAYPLYLEYQKAALPMADLQMISMGMPAELEGITARSSISVMRSFIAGDGFRMLGVTPALGRLLRGSDDHVPYGSDVAVVSFDLWQKRFNRDPSVIGRMVRINQHAYQIVGVAEKGFFGVEPGTFTDVWLPSSAYDSKPAFSSKRYHWLFILGRLKGGTRQQLQARLRPVFQRDQAEDMTTAGDLPKHVRESILQEMFLVNAGAFGFSQFRDRFQRPVAVVFAIAVCLLTIACVNIASLLLARGTARSAEFAMRVSLGASRARLIRQMITESFTLSLLAGAGGWLIARLLGPALLAVWSTENNPIRLALLLDSKVLVFSTLVSCSAALLFGIAPAWYTSLALRHATGQAGKLRLGRWMVSGQIAAAFCLVTVGAAFSFTLWNLMMRDKGFNANQVYVAELGYWQPDYSGPNNNRLIEQLLEKVRTSPGVLSAGAAVLPIYQGSSSTNRVIVPGKPEPDRAELYYPVTSGYLPTLQTHLLAGRDFRPQDTQAKEPIAAIVNRMLAERYFHARNVVGKQFKRGDSKYGYEQFKIVGVVENAFYSGTRKGAEPIVYLPIAGGPVRSFTMYVRSPLRMHEIDQLMREQAALLGTHLRTITTLDTIVGNSIVRERMLAGLGASFGTLSLLLASIGVFGLLNYSVQQRRKELGIRAALGATRTNLVALVAHDLFTMMGAGVIGGLLVSLSAMPVLKSLFFGIETYDPSVMATAACCFLVAAFIAGGLPARRAASIDPNVALREE